MATDATGPVTSQGIPTYQTSVDAPSGKGFNAAMTIIDTLITSALKTVFKKAGAAVGTRRAANLTDTTDVTFTVADDAANDKVDISAALTNAQKLPTTSIGDGDVPVWDSTSGTWMRAGAKPVPIAKLSGYPSDATKVLKGDGSWGTAGAMTMLDDLTVTGSVLASYDTNTRLGGNIPATFKHLRLIVTGRGDIASTSTAMMMKVNNDATAGNYSGGQLMQATGGTHFDGSQAPSSLGSYVGDIVGNTFTAGRRCHAIIEIPNYLETTFQKSYSSHVTVMDSYIQFLGSGWASTAAITRLALTPATGNFMIGSRFTLYGIS